MALTSLLHDPNISAFLDRIPQNQHVITLKQLIYIGIKIVSNSFHSGQSGHNTLSEIENKQNKKTNLNKQKSNKKPVPQEKYKLKPEQKKLNKSKSNHSNALSNKQDKIQSTLLREISKIRMQLESLTNKVYDHYFDQENPPNKNDESIEMNGQRQAKYSKSYGFNYPQNIPTFSPPKNNQVNPHATNPFSRQKNNFFVTQANIRPVKQAQRKQSPQYLQQAQQFQRNRARSNLMHLDDTQVRQALYKQQNSQSQQEHIQKNKQKKCHSLIEKRHHQKKKGQQKYFYQLNVDKKNLKELQKFNEFKHTPDASYRDFVQDRLPTIDQFKKKAKSKIKSLVERDRLKYQSKVDQQNFQKGFQQYEYSANELDQNEAQQSQENSSNHQETFEKDQNSNNNESSHRKAQQYMNSPEAEYEREREISNQNFGFYKSKGQSSPAIREQKGFNRNQDASDKIMDQRNDESSFSEFSQFSMSSNNSRREIGKISRKRNE